MWTVPLLPKAGMLVWWWMLILSFMHGWTDQKMAEPTALQSKSAAPRKVARGRTDVGHWDGILRPWLGTQGQGLRVLKSQVAYKKMSKLVVIKTACAFCRFVSATFCCRTGRRRSSISCVNPCLKSVECQVIPSYLDSRDVLELSKTKSCYTVKILEHPRDVSKFGTLQIPSRMPAVYDSIRACVLGGATRRTPLPSRFF